MDAVLAAGLVVVGAIAILNLLLTFGVIRRLREHNDLLADGAGAAREAPTMTAVGKSIGQLTATAVDGSVVSLDRFDGPMLVGAFSPGCEACEEKLPVFVNQARDFPGGRQHVLALVVASDAAEAASYVDALADVAAVVREEDRHGPVSAALGITGFPAFALVDASGVVRASALDPRRLPSPAVDAAASR